MLKTLPLEGGVPVRGRGYLSIREVLHPPMLHPLRFARPPDMGTVMDTTSLKLGDSYAECKADAARYVPTGWCSQVLCFHLG